MNANANRQLCRGFESPLRIDQDLDQIVSTIYAVLPDESVLKADETLATNEFAKGKNYRKTSLTMADIRAMIAKGEVEFIGNYPIPPIAG